MIAVREAWYEECGGAPPGNKLALEREQWQQPVDSGAISVRGKRVRCPAWHALRAGARGFAIACAVWLRVQLVWRSAPRAAAATR
jgi:hypothetical protein